MQFNGVDRDEILTNLERDVEILQKHNVMDYSLLLAIERNPSYKDGLDNNSFELKSKII